MAPPQRTASVWTVAVLYAGTLGLYGLYWGWTTGGRIDRFWPRAGAFRMFRRATVLTAVSCIFYALVVTVAVAMLWGLQIGKGPGLALLIAPGAVVAAAVVHFDAGLWRAWKAGRPGSAWPLLVLLVAHGLVLLGAAASRWVPWLPDGGVLLITAFLLGGVAVAAVHHVVRGAP